MKRHEQNIVIEYDEVNTFKFSYIEKKSYDDHSILVLSWWGRYSHPNNEKFQWFMLKLWMLPLVHQDNFYPELAKNVFPITYIQV